jgi:antitoxin VapB
MATGVTAKLFRQGGSQAVRLPKAFRFEGTEVLIERNGEVVMLKPLPQPRFRDFAAIGRYLATKFPADSEFPEPPPRPGAHERPAPDL